MIKEKILISKNKTLKLTNVLMKSVDFKKNEGIEKETYQMENYLKNKGAKLVGPLIQYTSLKLNELEKPTVELILLRQMNKFLCNVESPYKMESVMKIKNCMYARYRGSESKLSLAYDKINVVAFEEDIEIKSKCYTIIISSEDSEIVADIFVERVENE